MSQAKMGVLDPVDLRVISFEAIVAPLQELPHRLSRHSTLIPLRLREPLLNSPAGIHSNKAVIKMDHRFFDKRGACTRTALSADGTEEVATGCGAGSDIRVCTCFRVKKYDVIEYIIKPVRSDVKVAII